MGHESLVSPTKSRVKRVWRLLGRDGTFNIKGLRSVRFPLDDLYHDLLSMSWFSFLCLVVVGYTLVNVVFGAAYALCPPGSLEGVHTETKGSYFSDCFFFSVQTLATIGYGRISPVGLWPNILVTIEALIGVLSLALMTGIVFSRFSRPSAKIIYSEKAIIAPHDGELSFFFRIANERLNQIAEAHINLVLVRNEVTVEGQKFRNFYDLKLERNHTPVFALSWTVIHLIDANSPLYGLNQNGLEEIGAEFFVSLSGIDETLSQPIHSRYSYTVADLAWGMRFSDVISRSEDGKLIVNLQGIHDMVALTTADSVI